MGYKQIKNYNSETINNRVNIAATLILGSSLLPFSAIAEAESEAETEESKGLEVIVITAERRSVGLQSTAISGSVLGEGDLAKKGVVTVQDLQNATPGLSITEGGLTLKANIRGIGYNATTPVINSGVITFRDNLFQAPVVQNTPLFDIESVEVLRGPQGTFVGQSSTGGAILINSKDPILDDVEGYVTVSAGNYNDYGLQGAINLPIAENMAMRLAFDGGERDSFSEHIPLTPDVDIEPGNSEDRNIRLGLLWEPIDELQFIFKSENVRSDSDGIPFRPKANSPVAGTEPDDPFKLQYNFTDTVFDQRATRNSLEVNYLLDNDMVIRSVSGYQKSKFINNYDTDGSPIPVGFYEQTGKEEVYSQEINIISPEDGAFNWVVGAFYNDNIVEPGVVLHPGGPIRVDVLGDNSKGATALFGHGSYELTEKLVVQAGLRYSHETTQGNGVTQISLIDGPIINEIINDQKTSDDLWTGKLGLDYQLDSDTFIYGFVARGAKGGGYDNGLRFDPETLWNYEIGLKQSLFDNHVNIQVNAFYTDFRDFQIQAFNPLSLQESVINASDATTQGIEFQAQARYGELGLDMSAAYINTDISPFDAIDLALTPSGSASRPQCGPGEVETPYPGTTCFDYINNYTVTLDDSSLPYAPEVTFTMGVQYDFYFESGASLTPRINFTYTSEQESSVFQREGELLEQRRLWNVQVTYYQDDWKVELYGTNVNDYEYITGMESNLQLQGSPRQYGVRVTRDF